MRNVYGIVKSPHANALATYVGAPLTLRLQDQRELEFAIAKVLTPKSVLVQQLAPVGSGPATVHPGA